METSSVDQETKHKSKSVFYYRKLVPFQSSKGLRSSRKDAPPQSRQTRREKGPREGRAMWVSAARGHRATPTPEATRRPDSQRQASHNKPKPASGQPQQA